MVVSVLVPAYNEEKRIKSFLKELFKIVNNEKPKFEVIVINDGSKDNTLKILKQIKKKENGLKIITYEKNKGKGGALKEGFKKAKGEKIIFIDADGAIPPKEIPRMAELLNKHKVVVGSRYHKDSKVQRQFMRRITSIGFNTLVSMLFQSSWRDNLCGFKGFQAKVGKELFSHLESTGWIFDVELFHRIRKKKLKVHYMPIEWKHISGGNISFSTPLKMAWGLVKLRMNMLKQ